MSEIDSVLSLLRAGREIISDPAKWTQGWYFKSKDGFELHSDDREAFSCFCSVGALIFAANEDYAKLESPIVQQARRKLDYEAKRIDGGRSNAIRFNDNHTHAEVLNLWDKVIAKMEATT